jgi:serine/threonine protein kinase
VGPRCQTNPQDRLRCGRRDGLPAHRCVHIKLCRGWIYIPLHFIERPESDVGGACCGFGCTAFEREGHDQPLIHRDLKSPNLLLAEVPGPGTEVLVKITDFGLSKDKSFDNAKQTAMMTGCGSVLWMAPEILTGETYRQNSESIYL